MMKPVAIHAAGALALALALLTVREAGAAVRREGTWPTTEKTVTFRHDGTRDRGVKKLAEEAGWSLVLPESAALGDEKVHLALKGESPSNALDALLEEGDWIATRKGNLVKITRADAGASSPGETGRDGAAEDGTAERPREASGARPGGERARDRSVMGGRDVIGKGEVVGDVTVLGGRVDIYGHVKRDLTVMGGTAIVHEGAHIDHDVSVMGGRIELEKGSQVDGDVGVLGGRLRRREGSIVGGNVLRSGGEDGRAESESESEGKHGFVRRLGDALTNAALLFVLGVLFLALAPARMESLRVEIARRPMRQLAMGVVGGLGFLVAFALLCVTIIGIPIALVALVLGLLATYGAMVAALTTGGAALVRHRSENTYVHLAVGCLVFLVVSPLPWIGSWFTAALVLMGVGTLVSTRVAGYFPERRRSTSLSEGPYR